MYLIRVCEALVHKHTTTTTTTTTTTRVWLWYATLVLDLSFLRLPSAAISPSFLAISVACSRYLGMVRK